MPAFRAGRSTRVVDAWARPARGGRSARQAGSRRRCAAAARRPRATAAPLERRGARRGAGGAAERARRRRAAASAARRSSRRRWCWSSCCAATPREPATSRAPSDGRRTRSRRWPAAGSTTSSAAVSRGTASTRTGRCRTSRRCSTTTPSCCGSTLHWWRATGSPLARRVVEETAAWLLRRPADTPRAGSPRRSTPTPPSRLGRDGTLREGAFYVWTPEQLREVLGDDGRRVGRRAVPGLDGGSFERGTSVLRLPARAGGRRALGAAAGPAARPPATLRATARRGTTRWSPPGTASPIAALAEAGALLDRPTWIAAARAAADLVLAVHARRDGDGVHLVRTSRDGVAGRAPGCSRTTRTWLTALLALVEVTGEARYLAVAGELLDAVTTRFADADGVLYDTAAGETDPVLAAVRRPRDVADGPTPSGTAAAAGALLRYAALTGSTRHRVAAERALAVPLLLAPEHPIAAAWSLAVLEAVLDGPRQVAVVGPPDDPATAAAAPRGPRVVRTWRGRRGRAARRAGRSPAGRPALAGRPASGLRVPWLRVRQTDDRRGRAGGAAGQMTARLTTPEIPTHGRTLDRGAEVPMLTPWTSSLPTQVPRCPGARGTFRHGWTISSATGRPTSTNASWRRVR